MIEDEVVSEHYFTARDGREGAIKREKYIGRERPSENVINELWPLLGYELKTKLAGMGGI